MLDQLNETLRNLVNSAAGGVVRLAQAGTNAGHVVFRKRSMLVVLGSVGLLAYASYRHPPLQTLAAGEVGIRSNQFLGGAQQFHEGPVVVIPGVQTLRRFSLRDRIYRAGPGGESGNATPFQSIEGLSLGVDLNLRYRLDPTRIMSIAQRLPEDIDGEVVAPAVQGVIYKILARYTVKEIFSTKRAEIQQAIEAEIKPRLASDGILLGNVEMGRVELPPDYRAGMERLLAEELETEKMRYTLALKDQQVKQTALEGEAEKTRREKAAEAAANEQVIAARGQEEAMKHVLPFKKKQIEQRQFEAEAEKVSRIKGAEGTAAARRIEAAGEADSREKLADAEAYRLEHLGKIASAQMERDGELLSKHPLLIQKTMADKLSDKISVIIAPPSTGGGFIGAALLGQQGSMPMSTTRTAAETSNGESE